jgi:hypothetical protein
MKSSPIEPLDDVIKGFHRHTCHSTQMWRKGQTEPYPCDCGLKAQLTKYIEEQTDKARLDERNKMLEYFSNTEPKAQLRASMFVLHRISELQNKETL